MQANNNLFSKASEAAVLGSMILGPICIPSVLEWVDRDSFFLPKHQIVFDALQTVWKRSQDFDGLLVRTELENRGQLEEIGGLEYLEKMVNTLPSAANAVFYAKIVAEKKRYRGLVDAVDRMSKALDEPDTVDEQIEQIQELALSLDRNPATIEAFTTADHATNIALATQDHRETISTGFRNIDRVIGGIEPGQLIVVAARPSMGKTALALDVALNTAKAGRSIVFFTLEMSHQSLIERACCSLGCVNSADIKCESPTQKNLDKFYGASLELAKYLLTIHEAGTTPENQLAFIRKWKQAHSVDIVFVDYLQLMNGLNRSENRQQEITTISRMLKLTAIREQVPVIALSQLNRQVEARENHRPRMSDLRESGSIEQDADIIMLLHREDYYRKIKDPDTQDLDGAAEVIIAKNRNGPTGTAKLAFLEKYTKFGDLINCPI